MTLIPLHTSKKQVHVQVSAQYVVHVLVTSLLCNHYSLLNTSLLDIHPLALVL